MQIGKVINLKNCGDFLDFFKKNKEILVLLLFFITGFFIGIISLNRFEGFGDFFATRLDAFIALRAGGSFFKISCDSFFLSLMFIIFAFIFGSSILGIVFIPFLVSAAGIYYGGIMALLYSEYALKGVAFSAVLVLPPAVIFAVGLILAARESVGFSVRIAKLTFPRTVPANLFYDFKNYCGRYLFICILILLSAVADGLISANFLKSFTL